MLSRSVQLLWNDFLISKAARLNLNVNELEQRLREFIESDDVANYIMSNDKNQKFLLFKKTGPGLIQSWKWSELFTDFIVQGNSLINKNVIYSRPNFQIYAYKPAVINSGGDNVGGTGRIFYSGTSPIKRVGKTIIKTDDGYLIETTKNENVKAGFETKNILLIGLAAAAIYFIIK